MTRSYLVQSASGWTLGVTSDGLTTIALLTNDALESGYYHLEMPGDLLLDLKDLKYRPRIYHEGGDTAPLVIWSGRTSGRTV